MNSFLDSKAARFDQLPGRHGVGLVPEANCLLLDVDRRADIFSSPIRAEPPDFFQLFDRSCGIDLAHEMNPSSGEWEAPGGNQPTQGSTQQPRARAASHLSGGLAAYCRRVVMVHIPAPEERGLGFDLVERAELEPRPKAADPQR